MIKKIKLCYKAVRNILSNKEIIMDLDGNHCKTYIGSEISPDRFRSLLICQLQKVMEV